MLVKSTYLTKYISHNCDNHCHPLCNMSGVEVEKEHHEPPDEEHIWEPFAIYEGKMYWRTVDSSKGKP